MAGHGAVEGGVMLNLSAMKGLSVDPERRVAWAQPGVTAGEYGAKAQEHGLATPFGDVGSVGIAGLTLGGGSGTWPVSTAWRSTTSSRPMWSPRTGASSRRARRSTRTCSGPSAVGAATSGS